MSNTITATADTISKDWNWDTTSADPICITKTADEIAQLFDEMLGIKNQLPKAQSNYKNMKIVAVKFKGSNQIYEFLTNLKLQPGALYNIVADDKIEYNNPVYIVEYKEKQSYSGPLRILTKANIIKGAPLPDDQIVNVWFNEGTTTIKWKDGTVTTVTTQWTDDFDPEKGIALCYMKKFFNNLGAFNKVFDKWIPKEVWDEYAGWYDID